MLRQTQSTAPIPSDDLPSSGMPSAWEQYRPILVPIGLVVLTFFVFITALGNDFLVGWEDDFYITQNTQVTDFSIGNIVDHWTGFRRGEYIPLTLTSYSIQNIIFGDSPMGYRVVNIALHAFSGVLIYLCLGLLQPRQSVAIFAAVMFLIHPVQVESVVWVSQHKTVLSGTLFLASFWLHLYASRKKGRQGAIIASYALFALSILAKPAVILGGILFLAVDFLWLRLTTSQIAVRNIPYLVMGLIGAVLVMLAQNDNGGLPSSGTDNPLQHGQLVLHAIWDYAASLVLPFNLNNLYIYDIEKVGLTDFRVWLGLIFVVATLAITFLQPWGKKISAFAVLWFWLLLVPLLNVVPNGYPRADRFLYLSGVMIFVLLALALNKLADTLKRQEATYGVLAILVAISVVFGLLTISRNGVWSDTGTLMRDHLTDYPQSLTGLAKLANYELRTGDLQGAAETTQTLVNTYPNYVDGLDIAALLVIQQGNYRQAVDIYARILNLQPDDEATKERLGFSLVQLGLQAFEAGEYPTAIQLYVEALNYIPDADSAPIHNNIGFAYYTMGENEQALIAYNEAIARNADYDKAWLNVGDAALNLANYELARNAYSRALELEASFNAQNASNFCLALGELRQDPEIAIRFCQVALDIEPDNGLYLGRTAHVLLIFGSNEEALKVAQRSVEVDPNLVLNWRVFGDALRLAGDIENARLAYQQALALNPNNQGALNGMAALEQGVVAPEATPGQ